MTEATWMQFALQKHVAPPGCAPTVESRIRHAARALKWKFSRVMALWYADERASIKPRELRQVEDHTGLEYGQTELRAVEDIISNADALLMGNDPDFYGAFVAGMRAFAGAFYRARASRNDPHTDQ